MQTVYYQPKTTSAAVIIKALQHILYKQSQQMKEKH